MRGREPSDGSTDRWSRSDWWGVVLDAPDAPALAHFWSELLGWPIGTETEQHCTMSPDDGGVAYLAVQRAENYVPPTWPNAPGAQQMMLHLDFEVVDLIVVIDPDDAFVEDWRDGRTVPHVKRLAVIDITQPDSIWRAVQLRVDRVLAITRAVNVEAFIP